MNFSELDTQRMVYSFFFISGTTTVYFCFERQCYLVKSQKTLD